MRGISWFGNGHLIDGAEAVCIAARTAHIQHPKGDLMPTMNVATTRLKRGVLAGATLAVLGTAVAATPGVAAPVSAREVEREKAGYCTGTSRWELGLEKEGGRIEVDLEIDTRRVDRKWRVRIVHNENLFVAATYRTDRDREIDIEKLRPNYAGTDKIRFKARDLVNGEICTGSLSI
jgi:hypothetical protein